MYYNLHANTVTVSVNFVMISFAIRLWIKHTHIYTNPVWQILTEFPKLLNNIGGNSSDLQKFIMWHYLQWTQSLNIFNFVKGWELNGMKNVTITMKEYKLLIPCYKANCAAL